MTIRLAPTATVAIDGTAYTLRPEELENTLDETWSPFAQMRLRCAVPPAAVLAALDPRTDPRCTVTIQEAGATPRSRQFKLGVRSRAVDYAAASLALELASDEAQLQDRGHTGTTPDATGRAYEANLRNLTNWVLSHLPGTPTLAADAGATADLTVYTDSENLLINPSAEVDAGGWTGTNCTLARGSASGPGVVGGFVFALSAPTNALSFMLSHTIPVTPGVTYQVSGNWMQNGTPSGTPDPRAKTMVVLNADGSKQFLCITPQAASSGARVTATFTCPEGVSTVQVRAYLGWPTFASGSIRWDGLVFKALSGAHDTGYWDGDTPDTAQYRYDWSGNAHQSSSKRTNITGVQRSPDMFTIVPGETWWDYLEPLVQAAGLRLYCDGLRRWHLVDPETWLIDGAIAVDSGRNLRGAEDKISRDTETWADAVVIHYRWTTTTGAVREAWDSSGTGTKVFTVERETPYPGPGAAAAIKARMARRGHVVAIEAMSDVLASPSQIADVVLPDGSTLTSAVVAVRMDLPAGDMAVTLRDPIETPRSAWTKLAAGESWLESPVGESWLEEVV